MEQIMTGIGLIGVAGVIAAYGLLSSGRWRADEARYQLLNIGGTVGVLLSLLVEWNQPSFILNSAWLVIGLVGLFRLRRTRSI